MAQEIDLRILGGLPVTVEFTVAPAEPDVGIFSAYVDDWWITAINGRPVKNCAWLDRRIDATKGEEERIREALNDHTDDDCDDRY